MTHPSLFLSLILAVAAPPPEPFEVIAESPAGAYWLALRDIKRLPSHKWYCTRYLALYAAEPADRDRICKALTFWSNSLTWRKQVVRLPMVGDGLLLRIDLDDLGWDVASRAERVALLAKLGVVLAASDVSKDAWETLGRRDPYFRYSEVRKGVYRRGWIDPDVAYQLRAYTQSNHPVLRADWFLVQSSIDRPLGAYSDFLQLPSREADLYKVLLIDEKNSRLQALTVGGATQAGQSIVALGQREVELLRGAHGDLWRTFDFDVNKIQVDVKGEKNPRLRFRGTVKHDGREIIWQAPNGLSGYYLANGQGVQVGEVPTTIAQDQRSNPGHSPKERVVRNAWKCVDCHGPSSGFIPFRDQVAALMKAEGAGLLVYGNDRSMVAKEKRKLEDYYLEHFRPRMAADRDGYSDAVEATNGLEVEANSTNFVKWIEQYQYESVNRGRAARELGLVGMDDDVIDRVLKNSGQADLIALQSGVDQVTSRPQFELAFAEGMLGIPVYPWEVNVKVEKAKDQHAKRKQHQ